MALGADALTVTEAYQRHELQRTHRSLLFCAIALLDAMDQTEPLKQFGLHLKLVHNDPRLYLISHRSLGQRGLSTAEASTYNMLAPDHRLFFPFSLQQLLVDPSGKALPAMTVGPGSSAYAAVAHLEALTTNSLALALAHAIVADGPWDSLDLLSGSCLADIITALDEFCSRYDRHRWPHMLREAIPGLTEQDIDWLSSLQDSLSGPLPPPSPPTARPKRKSDDQTGLAQRRVRTALGGTAPREPARRSTRLNTATVTHDTPPQAQETPPPSPLAASHGHLKPQFAQAFARLYGTAQHRGIIASMTILRPYCHCLGATWNSRSRDPVVFFRTPDMAGLR